MKGRQRGRPRLLLSVPPGVGFAYSPGDAVMAQSKKYELTAWDRIKYPTMAVGGLAVLAIGVGLIFFGLADLLKPLFR